MSLQVCSDTTEASELCERYGLYLKPMWKIKISVQLPALKAPGQAISSWKVMEKLKNMIKPDEFISLKVSKTNLVLIQFEGEVEKKSASKRVLQKLQSNSMKLSGFTEILKIRAAPAKLNYPTRHDWDSFFRDAKNIDEMKPGERPDTVYVQNLPTKWFADDSCEKPSEYVLKKVFEAFGDIRHVAIPSIQIGDSNETFVKVSNFNRDLVFDAYVQYKEYISFVKAMDALKGMKLVCKSELGKAYSADIKVDFDKTKYLSDKSIRQRTAEQKIIAEKNISEQLKEQITTQPIKEKVSEPKKEKVFHNKQQKSKKSTVNKAKLLREKEAMHLLKALLHKAEMTELDKKAKEKEQQIAQERLQQQKLLERALEEEKRRKEEEEKEKQKFLQEQEKLLRQKLLKSLKAREQRRTEQLREKLRKEIAGRKVLKSVLVVSSKDSKPEKYNHTRKRLKS